MRVQSKSNRNSTASANTFMHANLLWLDSELRKTLHGQPAKFPLSEALHASARLGTKKRQIASKQVLRLGSATRVISINRDTAIDKIAPTAKQQIREAMGINEYGWEAGTICISRVCSVDYTPSGTALVILRINPQALYKYKEYAGCYSLIAK